MERRAANPRDCASIFGIPLWRLRAAIAAGELVPRAIGRKSFLLFTNIERWIESHPPTKSSRPNRRNEHAPEQR